MISEVNYDKSHVRPGIIRIYKFVFIVVSNLGLR